MYKKIFFCSLLGYLTLTFITANCDSLDTETQKRMEIIGLLKKWPKDFNAKKIQDVCGLFAHDVIASYPGTEDRNYAELCRQLSEAMLSSDKSYIYETPKIEQILLNDDIAVVRLTWTLNVTRKDSSNIEVVHEKGLDVFKRQPDGSWKIVISYAFPL